MAKTFEQLVPAPAGAFRRHQPSLQPGRGGEAARLRADRLHAGREGRQSPLGIAEERALRQFARRRHRQPGDAAGARRTARDLSVGLAGRRRRQHRGRDVSGPEPLSRQCRPGTVPPHQPHLPACRPDRALRRRRQDRLVRADRRRRGSGLRRSAELVRDHEGLYRGGRGRRSLRGPARIRKEVRPHGRQGADPDRGP